MRARLGDGCEFSPKAKEEQQRNKADYYRAGAAHHSQMASEAFKNLCAWQGVDLIRIELEAAAERLTSDALRTWRAQNCKTRGIGIADFDATQLIELTNKGISDSELIPVEHRTTPMAKKTAAKLFYPNMSNAAARGRKLTAGMDAGDIRYIERSRQSFIFDKRQLGTDSAPTET